MHTKWLKSKLFLIVSLLILPFVGMVVAEGDVDLVLVGLTAVTDSPTAKEPLVFEIEYQVVNREYIPDDVDLNVTLTLKDSEGNEFAIVSNTLMLPEESDIEKETITVEEAPAAGDYTVMVQLDSDGDLAETNEGNNQNEPLTVTIHEASGAVKVLSLTLEPETAIPGQTVEWTAVVQNNSGSKVENLTIRVISQLGESDPKEEDSQEIDVLEDGERTEAISGQFVARLEKGEYAVEASISAEGNDELAVEGKATTLTVEAANEPSEIAVDRTQITFSDANFWPVGDYGFDSQTIEIFIVPKVADNASSGETNGATTVRLVGLFVDPSNRNLALDERNSIALNVAPDASEDGIYEITEDAPITLTISPTNTSETGWFSGTVKIVPVVPEGIDAQAPIEISVDVATTNGPIFPFFVVLFGVSVASFLAYWRTTDVQMKFLQLRAAGLRQRWTRLRARAGGADSIGDSHIAPHLEFRFKEARRLWQEHDWGETNASSPTKGAAAELYGIDAELDALEKALSLYLDADEELKGNTTAAKLARQRLSLARVTLRAGLVKASLDDFEGYIKGAVNLYNEATFLTERLSEIENELNKKKNNIPTKERDRFWQTAVQPDIKLTEWQIGQLATSDTANVNKTDAVNALKRLNAWLTEWHKVRKLWQKWKDKQKKIEQMVKALKDAEAFTAVQAATQAAIAEATKQLIGLSLSSDKNTLVDAEAKNALIRLKYWEAALQAVTQSDFKICSKGLKQWQMAVKKLGETTVSNVKVPRDETKDKLQEVEASVAKIRKMCEADVLLVKLEQWYPRDQKYKPLDSNTPLGLYRDAQEAAKRNASNALDKVRQAWVAHQLTWLKRLDDWQEDAEKIALADEARYLDEWETAVNMLADVWQKRLPDIVRDLLIPACENGIDADCKNGLAEPLQKAKESVDLKAWETAVRWLQATHKEVQSQQAEIYKTLANHLLFELQLQPLPKGHIGKAKADKARKAIKKDDNVFGALHHLRMAGDARNVQKAVTDGLLAEVTLVWSKLKENNNLEKGFWIAHHERDARLALMIARQYVWRPARPALIKFYLENHSTFHEEGKPCEICQEINKEDQADCLNAAVRRGHEAWRDICEKHDELLRYYEDLDRISKPTDQQTVDGHSFLAEMKQTDVIASADLTVEGPDEEREGEAEIESLDWEAIGVCQLWYVDWENQEVTPAIQEDYKWLLKRSEQINKIEKFIVPELDDKQLEVKALIDRARNSKKPLDERATLLDNILDWKGYQKLKSKKIKLVCSNLQGLAAISDDQVAPIDAAITADDWFDFYVDGLPSPEQYVFEWEITPQVKTDAYSRGDGKNTYSCQFEEGTYTIKVTIYHRLLKFREEHEKIPLKLESLKIWRSRRDAMFKIWRKRQAREIVAVTAVASIIGLLNRYYGLPSLGGETVQIATNTVQSFGSWADYLLAFTWGVVTETGWTLAKSLPEGIKTAIESLR